MAPIFLATLATCVVHPPANANNAVPVPVVVEMEIITVITFLIADNFALKLKL